MENKIFIILYFIQLYSQIIIIGMKKCRSNFSKKKVQVYGFVAITGKIPEKRDISSFINEPKNIAINSRTA